jgi:hypothetical protein
MCTSSTLISFPLICGVPLKFWIQFSVTWVLIWCFGSGFGFKQVSGFVSGFGIWIRRANMTHKIEKN